VTVLHFDWLISLSREPITKVHAGPPAVPRGPGLVPELANPWRAWSLGISEHPLHKDLVVCTTPTQWA
jgi:hypothetical protein